MWLPDFLARWYDRFAPIHGTNRVKEWRYVTPPLVTSWVRRLLREPNTQAAALDEWVETASFATREERTYKALQAGSIACETAGIVTAREADWDEWRDIRAHWRRNGNLLLNEKGLLLPRRGRLYAWDTTHPVSEYDEHSHFQGFLRWRDRDYLPSVKSFVCVDPIGPADSLSNGLTIGVVPLIASRNDFVWTAIDPPYGASRFRAALREPDHAEIDAIDAVGDAADKRCDMLVFPELCLTPDGQQQLGAAIRRTTTSSGGYPWLVVAGTAEHTIGGDHFNRAVVFDGEGREVFSYDKLHPYQIQPVEQDRYGLFDALGEVPREEDITTVDRRFCIADTPAGRVAVVICEDLSNLATYLPLTTKLEVDWLLVPVLDGIQTENRWTARRAREFAERGTSVVVVTSSSLVTAHFEDLTRKGETLPPRGVGLIARRGGEFMILESTGRHNRPTLQMLVSSRE